MCLFSLGHIIDGYSSWVQMVLACLDINLRAAASHVVLHGGRLAWLPKVDIINASRPIPRLHDRPFPKRVRSEANLSLLKKTPQGMFLRLPVIHCGIAQKNEEVLLFFCQNVSLRH